jgi:hypothetical protein
MTVPTAGRSGWAFCSLTSATRQIISSRASRLMRFLAETSTNSVSPPMAGGLEAARGELLMTLLGLASGLSILLTATMIGTLAARAWSMASRVWGMTPSSAATTMTTMSVTLAPRARMRVKAS